MVASCALVIRYWVFESISHRFINMLIEEKIISITSTLGVGVTIV